MSYLSALESFYEDGWITDVLYVVKSGKEATVYCCRAGPTTGGALFAAKVYRARESRSFKNDAIYQEGRAIRSAKRAHLDRRLQRAVKNKTAAGRAFQFTSWIGHEFETLSLLHAAGADVPKPLACSDGAMLMEYLGDAGTPAPMLHDVALDPEEARRLFHRVMRNVELWLACDRVHADLSAFNILYWRGRVTIIDFPQAIDPRSSPSARALLARDVENVCRYFAEYSVRADPVRIANDLWRRFLHAEL